MTKQADWTRGTQARVGPMIAYFEKFLDCQAGRKALGFYCLHFAIDIVFQARYRLPELTNHLISALYHAELALSQGLWKGNSDSLYDPIKLTYAVECEIEFGFLTGSKSNDVLSRNICKCVAAAIWCCSRIEGKYPDLISRAYALDDFCLHDTRPPWQSMPCAQIAAFACLSYFWSSLSALHETIPEADQSQFPVRVMAMLSSKPGQIGTVGELTPLSQMEHPDWRTMPFLAVYLRLLGRSGWLSVVSTEIGKVGNLSVESIEQALGDVEPSFNLLDSKGIPIPGKIREFSSDEKEAGMGVIRGLKKTANGISIWADDYLNGIPLITDEDLDVAKALAFNYSEPHDVAFSLEHVLSIEKGEKQDGILQRKEFEPEWLANTAFGRSLFFSDYLMQQIIGCLDVPLQSLMHISISRKSGDAAGDMDFSFLKSLYRPSDPNDNGVVGSRFCIKISDIHASYFPEASEILYLSGGAYIESSLIRLCEDGAFDRMHRLNDPETLVGQSAAAFSSNYEKISELFPVFKRVEQLFILLKLLGFARNHGWQLSQVETARANLIRSNSDNENDKLVVPMSYHNNGCTCCGNWPLVKPVPFPDVSDLRKLGY